MSVENTLQERGARYGAFSDHAQIAQAIQSAYRVQPEKWEKLPPVIKQGLTVFADKIARALNGDEYYEDNYHDMGGYAKLMEDWVIKRNAEVRYKETAAVASLSANIMTPPTSPISPINSAIIHKI